MQPLLPVIPRALRRGRGASGCVHLCEPGHGSQRAHHHFIKEYTLKSYLGSLYHLRHIPELRGIGLPGLAEGGNVSALVHQTILLLCLTSLSG